VVAQGLFDINASRLLGVTQPPLARDILVWSLFITAFPFLRVSWWNPEHPRADSS
jgi:hypothetical protein